MTISIEIKSPELAEAINNLANALSKNNVSNFAIEATPLVPEQPTQNQQTQPVQQQTPQQPVPASIPTSPPPMQPVQQAQQAAPVEQSQSVPTSAPTYDMDQLAVAATQLVDAGRREELLQLLTCFGVQALTALPQEQYGAFATKLRELGAKI